MQKLLFVILIFIGLQLYAQTDSIKRTGWNSNPKSYQKHTNNTLVVVDRYSLKKEVLPVLNSDKIVSVNVLKNENATTKYGNSGKDGVLEITTKEYSKKELQKLAQLYAFEYQPNTGKSFTITGMVSDCEKSAIPNVTVSNLNSKETAMSDSTGHFKISVTKNDVLLFAKNGLEAKRMLVEKNKPIAIELKEIPKSEQIIYKKPVIYLYPTVKTEIEVTLDFKGKLQTTFPKYDKSWEVVAEPNGQIFDKNSKRYYNSLFWDGDIHLPEAHYDYQDGFIVPKEKLTSFFIEKLEHIGLNNQETNDFIQFWLPILERNNYNHIRFLVNDECNDIAFLNVNPKPTTSIRIYMEFYGLNEFTTIKAQQLPRIERKGFTLVEWGGTDVSSQKATNRL